MSGERGGQGVRTSPGKSQVVICFLEENLVRTSLEKQFDPPPPLGLSWIRARMSDGGIFFLHVAGLAIILSRAN